MAKKLHPLDVRYKGPSTAYTGKPRRNDKMIQPRGMEPVVLPEPAAAPKPAPPPANGPWTASAAPAPPPPPARAAPPPLPYSAAAPAPRPQPRRRGALGRVILILLAIAAMVSLVRVLSTPMELRMIEMPTSNRDAINL